jgi:hypothetical protein
VTPDDPYAQLQAPLGVPGSARLRYAAAMTLYQAGKTTAEVLEVYRSCASLDTQDPLALLAHYNLPSPVAAVAIAELLAEIGRYLAALSGPGIADVRRCLAQVLPPKIMPNTATPNPAIRQHLDAASAQVPGLAAAIRFACPHLRWVTYDGYDPEDIGEAFTKGHAYTTIIGKDAPIAAQEFDLGLFLIAPHVLYRDHFHAAPELYAPLTGPHGWRFGPNAPLTIKPAHQPIWNEPFAPHLTKVGPVPFLCIFAWTRDVDGVAQVIHTKDWAALEAMRLGGDGGA